jgi:phosphonate transport system substrate-binding protein
MAEPIRIATVPNAATTSGRLSTAAIIRTRQDFFARALSRYLGVPAEIRMLADYFELGGRVASGDVHLAWMPPMAAYRVLAERRAVALVLPMRMGSCLFTSVLFSRSGDARTQLSMLQGARAAWVDPLSASGYLVVRAGMRAAGWMPERIFAEQNFSGSHSAVVRAVLDGQADVGATYLHRNEKGAIERAGWGDSKVQILMEHGPVPSDALVASMQLPSELMNKIRSGLVDTPDMALLASARELFEAEAFTFADKSHFEALDRFIPYLDDEDRGRVSSLPPVR